MTTIIKSNQSTFDVATQLSGDVKAVLDFCIANELSITDDLTIGVESVDYNTLFKNDLISNYYSARGIELATGETAAPIEVLGIGNMIIESDFDIL
jgi:hypothetical protein